jgi:hypothetical protein
MGQIILDERSHLNVFGKLVYFFKHFLQVELLFLPLLVLSIMMACLSHSLLCYFNVELLSWNIPFSELVYEAVQDISITLILIFTIFMMIGMIAVNMALLFFSLHEVETGDALQNRIKRLENPQKMTAQA